MRILLALVATVLLSCSIASALPLSNFSANTTSGYAPLSVQFTDNSTNATSWNWDFGDGNNSTVQNPMYTYNIVKKYTVNLTVSDGNDTNSSTVDITVLEPGEEINITNDTNVTIPIANFIADNHTGVAPLTVKFNDTSTGSPNNWTWNFGDGFGTHTQHPVHIYQDVGVYNVTLNVSNSAGYNETAKINFINVTNETTGNSTNNSSGNDTPPVSTPNVSNVQSFIVNAKSVGQLSNVSTSEGNLTITKNQGHLSGSIAAVTEGVRGGYTLIVVGIGILGLVIVLRSIGYL